MGEGAVVCSQCGHAAGMPVVPETPALGSALPTPPSDGRIGHSAPLFSAMDDSADRGLTGIGGWLILHVIGLAVAPFLSLFGMVVDGSLLFGSKGQAVLAARPGLEAVILFELITNLVFLTALISLNFLFYMKKKAFPTYIILFFVTQFVLLLADHLMAARFNPSSNPFEVIRSFLICLIWIPYFLNSRRVQLTFVN
ncbi:MAG: DUF2569 domain-containing protein [Terracidiphilus sp.]